MSRRLQVAAHHEAGHAVVAVLNGVKVHEVRVAAGANYNGRTAYEIPEGGYEATSERVGG